MIVALLVFASAVGCLLGRLYSYVALLLVSPLLALVAAMAAWTMGSTGLKAAVLGIAAMALSQAGYLAGVVLDPRARLGNLVRKRAPRDLELAERHRPSASKR